MNPPRMRTVPVAVSGHRLNQLPDGELKRVRGDLVAAFAALEDFAQNCARPLRTVLRTGMAEGADRIAAHIACERAWVFDAYLPFSQARYEATFPDSVAEFLSLLASARRTICLDGERLAREEGPDAPYAALGRALTERADVLVCVWNGSPPRGPGGTSEVAALMLERGGLVLWVAVGGRGVKLVGPAPLPRAGSLRRALHEALAATFTRTARPPEMRIA